jgi:hypothetical protein
MRINAYILAATPDWLQASVCTYYDRVDRIVVTYDRDSLGWNRKPLEVEQCLQILRELDCDAKMTFSPGHYAREGYTPFENQTFQRQQALDEASTDADWVLQLDTDEVLGCTHTFFSALKEADEAGAQGLYYPARWLYQHVGRNWFLERSSRFWRIAAGFPGPMAVRAGTQLRHARQCDGLRYRLDFRSVNTDYCSPRSTLVDCVITPHQGVIHYAWIRDPSQLGLKVANHGDFYNKMDPKLTQWHWCGRHPLLATIFTPLMRRFRGRPMLRLARIRMHESCPSDNGNTIDLCAEMCEAT